MNRDSPEKKKNAGRTIIGLVFLLFIVGCSILGLQSLANMFSQTVNPVNDVNMSSLDSFAKEKGFDPATRNVTGSQVCYDKKLIDGTESQLCLNFSFQDNSTIAAPASKPTSGIVIHQ